MTHDEHLRSVIRVLTGYLMALQGAKYGVPSLDELKLAGRMHAVLEKAATCLGTA